MALVNGQEQLMWALVNEPSPVGFGFRVSGFGLRVSDFGFRGENRADGINVLVLFCELPDLGGK